MVKDVIIIGASGHGAEVHEYILYNERIKQNKELRIVGFLDEKKSYYDKYQFSAPFLGSITGHAILPDVFYLIAIANVKIRSMVVSDYLQRGARFLTLVHGSAYIASSAIIGEGAVIGPNVSVGPNAVIGDFCLINARCSIAHDTRIGKFNCLSPNVCLSGATIVGDRNFFGINSATLQKITIGNDNTIQAGMIIDQDIENDTTVFYRYKERVIAIPKK